MESIFSRRFLGMQSLRNILATFLMANLITIAGGGVFYLVIGKAEPLVMCLLMVNCGLMARVILKERAIGFLLTWVVLAVILSLFDRLIFSYYSILFVPGPGQGIPMAMDLRTFYWIVFRALGVGFVVSIFVYLMFWAFGKEGGIWK